MKKLFIAAAMVVFTMLSFTSCEETIVSSAETIDLLPKATITGSVMAELDLLKDGMESAPAGTLLLVEVNYSDINSAASAGKWMDTIQVTAEGKYSVQVPTDANGVTVKISPFSFEADQTQSFSENNYKTIKKVFSVSSISVAISAGNNVVKNITYSYENQPTFTYKGTITGKCTANLSAETPGLENAPNGTVLYFYTSEWKDSAIVSNGTYTIKAPDKTLNCTAQFTATKKVWDSASLTYKDISYKYTINKLYSAASIINVEFGEGENQTIDTAPNTTILSGTATADSDLTVSGAENMPDGTKIYFEDTDKTWGAIATVTSGKYTVVIPRSSTGIFTINYSVNYSATKKITVGSSIYNFTVNSSISTTTASTKTLNIYAY